MLCFILITYFLALPLSISVIVLLYLLRYFTQSSVMWVLFVWLNSANLALSLSSVFFIAIFLLPLVHFVFPLPSFHYLQGIRLSSKLIPPAYFTQVWRVSHPGLNACPKGTCRSLVWLFKFNAVLTYVFVSCIAAKVLDTSVYAGLIVLIKLVLPELRKPPLLPYYLSQSVSLSLFRDFFSLVVPLWLSRLCFKFISLP